MNPDTDINSPYSIITVGDFLIKAGSDLRSVLNTIFIGIGCLLSLCIPLRMAYIENDKLIIGIVVIIMSLILIVLFIHFTIFQYKGFNALIKAGLTLKNYHYSKK